MAKDKDSGDSQDPKKPVEHASVRGEEVEYEPITPEDDVPYTILVANKISIVGKPYPDHIVLVLRCLDGETLFIGDKTCIAKGKEIRIIVAKDSEVKKFIREGEDMTIVISKTDPEKGEPTEHTITDRVSKGTDPPPADDTKK